MAGAGRKILNNQHEIYMQRCLQLAANGMGHTRSNPMVGCVVVHGGKIIAEGYHKRYGGPHAEVEALSQITDKNILENCTVYVSLEPCSHEGKTPPCADLLLDKGIKKLVAASEDPNPLVSGKGFQKLRGAGIEIITGILDQENRELNKRFFTFQEKKRPYIVLKWAQSRDGWIAPENHKGQFKLTGHLSDILVHQWRSQEMGILVGRKTIEQDNPQLNVRHVEGLNPVRLVLDPENKTGSGPHLHQPAQTFVYNRHLHEKFQNVIHVKIEQENFLEAVLQHLYQQNISSVLVEGGSYTLQSFIKQNLWDEARIFECDVLLKNGIPAPYITGRQITNTKTGTDELTIIRHT